VAVVSSLAAVAAQVVPHFSTCAGLRGPNPCDCGVITTLEDLERHARLEALAPVLDWLDVYYGPIEVFHDGQRGMVQLSHGHEEYGARMDMAEAVRRAR
jgi:hypothetical protein